MFGLNGNRNRLLNICFALMDSLLIFGAYVLANYVRSGQDQFNTANSNYAVLKVMAIVCVVQMAFYYFDLYDPNTCRGRKKMFILMLEAIVASSVVLGVIYYLVPFLGIGREAFALSLALILIFTYLWRISFIGWSKTKALKERVLIVGTGALAMKIKKEITENGYDGFEIVGFVDENRENIGENI